MSHRGLFLLALVLRQAAGFLHPTPRIAVRVLGANTLASTEQEEILYATVPRTEDELVSEAAKAAARAIADGKRRGVLRIALPAKFANAYDDWPGGVAQQYAVAEPIARAILRRMENPNVAVVSRLKTKMIEPADCMAVVLAEAADRAGDQAIVVFPTTERFTTREMKEFLDEMGEERPVLLLNPGWKTAGDFGFFGRKAAVEALGPFIETYAVAKYVCRGEVVAVLRSYPGPWQVFVQQGKEAGSATKFEPLGTWAGEERPTYRDCERLLAGEAALDNWLLKSQSSVEFVRQNILQ